MNDITVLIKEVIIAAGEFPDPAMIKRNNIPDKPDDVISIIDTGGITPDANDTSIAEKINKTFQIYSRAPLDANAGDYQARVRRSLINQIGRIITDPNTGLQFELKNILMISEPQPIGKDATGRREYSSNYSTLVAAHHD